MEKSYKKNIFSILILLSISSLIEIISRNNIGEYEKVILLCLNFLFLFMISEYIETIIYYKVLKNIFECKNFSSSIIYKMFFIIIPIFSLLIYVIAWTSFSLNFINGSIFGILVLMGNSYLFLMVQMRYNIVFVNHDNLFLYKKIITFKSIKTHNISIKRGLGTELNKIEIVLYSGDAHSLRIDSKYTDEFIRKLQ